MARRWLKTANMSTIIAVKSHTQVGKMPSKALEQVVKPSLKYDIRYPNGIVIIFDQTVHFHLNDVILIRIVCQLRAFHQDAADRISETRKIIQVLGQSLEQRVIFR